MKTAKLVIAAGLAVAFLSGCVAVEDEASAPAPEAFTNCMRHFTDGNVAGPDASAANEVCAPFADEDNEEVQRLAEKHFRG